MSTTNDPSKITSVSVDSPADWTFARARQLEGTLDDDPAIGVWPITYQRILRGWGCLEMARQLGDSVQWPLRDPSLLDAVAKEHRRSHYYRVWNSRDVLRASAENHSVSASFRVTEKWRNPPEGKLDFDQPSSDVIGGHCLGVSPPLFFMPLPGDWWGEDNIFAGNNSWGRDWGNRGFFAMRHEFFDREMYEAWAMPARIEFPTLYGNGVQSVRWEPGGDQERRYLVFDLIDVDVDERMGWALACFSRGELHVEDLYVRPDYRGQGIAKRLMAGLFTESHRRSAPLRFWVPFADVDSDGKFLALKSFFERFSLRYSPSPFASAAFCVMATGDTSPPHFLVPPKPAYLFTGDTPTSTVDWSAIKRKHAVSDEFLEQAKSVFFKHGEILRRLS